MVMKPQIKFYIFHVSVWLCGTFICTWQPCHKLGMNKTQGIEGPVTMTMALLFLTPLLLDSWPAIILFAGAGKFMNKSKKKISISNDKMLTSVLVQP